MIFCVKRFLSFLILVFGIAFIGSSIAGHKMHDNDLELDVDGIGGIYPGNSFHSNYLPSRYKHSTIFQAFDISHKVDNSGWTTSIGGKMRATKGGVFIGLKHIQKVFGEMYDNMVSRARINTKDALKFKKQQDKEFDKALAKK